MLTDLKKMTRIRKNNVRHKSKQSKTSRYKHILSVLRNSLSGIHWRSDIAQINISDLKDIIIGNIN